MSLRDQTVVLQIFQGFVVKRLITKELCMKYLFMATTVVASMLLGQPSSAQALGVGIGPFSLSVGGQGVAVDSSFYRLYNDPICQAIKERNLIAIYIEQDNAIKRVVIEPYALGYNKDGNLVLQGYNVEAFDMSDEPKESGSGEGFIGGVFTTFTGDTWTGVSVNRVVRTEVLENTNFTVREDAFKNMKESDVIVEMICAIHP